MQKGDHVIVADLSLSLPLRQRPYLGRAHRLGHHDGVVPHVRGIGHRAKPAASEGLRFPTTRDPSPTVIDTCSDFVCNLSPVATLQHMAVRLALMFPGL